MFKRKNIPSNTKWESLVGYSRAVKAGNSIYVSGTTAVNEQGDILGEGDPYKQTVFILNKIKQTLEKAGADLTDVVRTRMFVANINDWQQIGKAHKEFFGSIKPAATMVEVSKLIDPRLLVEIEIEAVIE